MYADSEIDKKPAGEVTPRPKRRRGFAAMDPEKVRAIAHLGGLAAHKKGTAHRFSREEAREAGRKGGLASHRVRAASQPEVTEPVETKPQVEPTEPAPESPPV